MSRVQLALNVSDLDAAVEFYSALFKAKPHKVREGYANFDLTEPALKLVLIETSDRNTGTAGALNHLGVEVTTADDVDATRDQLVSAGLATFDERDTTCCYARQDKVWVNDPDGAPWEFYTITDDNPENAEGPSGKNVSELVAEESQCCTKA